MDIKKSFTLVWIYSSVFYRRVTLDHFCGVVKLEIYTIDKEGRREQENNFSIDSSIYKKQEKLEG